MNKPGLRLRLQICRENRLANTPETVSELERDGCAVELVDCHDQCTRCNTCAFALVAGQFLFAPTTETFLQQVRTLLEEAPSRTVKDSKTRSRKP